MTETLQEVNSNTSSAPVQKANYVVDEGFDVTEASSCNEGDLSAAKGSKKFVDEDSRSPEYRSDEWRMENFKVRQCSKRYAHDWTICPYAHPGEKARRRDPKIYTYDGVACPDMKKAGFCNRGDGCPYAHNVFEYWLHPTRYRTQLCKDGTSCARHVCFFAHTLQEMRMSSAKPPSPDPKTDKGRDGMASPDTPLLTNVSEKTSSSVSSADLWSSLADDRLRQGGPTLEESGALKNVSGSIDDVIYNLANVKLAMAGDKRNEVIKMLTSLLEEAVEEKQRDMKTPLTSRPRDNNVAGTLRGLNLQHSQALLAATQRRNPGSQLSDTGAGLSNNWSNDFQALTEDLSHMSGRVDSSRIGNHSALYTAPAGLERHSAASSSFASTTVGLEYAASEMPSRVFSADLGLPPAYYTQPQNPWHQKAEDALTKPQQASVAPLTHLYRPMSSDAESLTSLAPSSYLDGSLSDNLITPANPNALRRQPLSFEEALGQPLKRESRRHPISAFQSAAGQDYSIKAGKCAPGQAVSTDLKWGNSGSLASADLETIKEGIPQLSRAEQDLLRQCSSMEASYSILGDRTKSASAHAAYNTRLLSPSPYSTQRRGRERTNHSAPYDLSLAYQSSYDKAAHSVQYPTQRHNIYDKSCLLKGWGGLDPSDFGGGKF